MGYKRLRFGLSFVASVAVVLALVFVVFSTQLAIGALPLADVVGIGGLYLEANSFEGNTAKLYPVQGTGGTGPSGELDADTPVCKQRPMIAIELNDAFLEGFTARKDLQLPHLNDRWMTIEISQPENGIIDAQPNGEITFFTTQLRADNLTIRNVLIREGQPGELATQGSRISPRNQDLSNAYNPTSDKYGRYSGEFYLEGGNAPNSPGIVAKDKPFDGDSVAVSAWLHGITAQTVSFKTPGSAGAIDIDVSFPVDADVQSYYDDKLGYSGEESAPRFQRDNYFDCLPVEAQ